MQHTTTYKYRRLEVFDQGSNSNYYLDVPPFEAMVPDEIHTAATALLQGEAKKVIQLVDPHVIRNAVREQIDPLICYADITAFKNAVDSGLFRAAFPLDVCETEDEVIASKARTENTVIYDIEGQVIWRLETFSGIPYQMGTEGNIPGETVGRLNGLCVNPETGKFFLTNDRDPGFVRWPLKTSADELGNSDDFDPGQPGSVLNIVANATGALGKVSGHDAGLSDSVSLRINNGTKTIAFSDVSGFGTPTPITIDIQEDTTLKVDYTILFGILVQANIIGAQATFDQSQLPPNISYPTGLDLPITVNVPGGSYTFTFSDIQYYGTPDPITITANRFGLAISGKYEEKLRYGLISILQGKTGVSQTSRFTYSKITTNEGKTEPHSNDEAEYASSNVSILPL